MKSALQTYIKQLLAGPLARSSLRQLAKKIQQQPSRRHVLLVEFKTAHYETLVGYAYYFLQLGYTVHVASKKTDALIRLRHANLVVYSLPTYDALLYFLAHPSISQLHTSLVNTYYLSDQPVASYHPRLLQQAAHPLAVLHSTQLKEYQQSPPQQRFLTLAPLPVAGYRSFVVNPHHFGSYQIALKPSHATTRFVVIGNASQHRRNYQLLLQALDQLQQLTNQPFSVTICGSQSQPIQHQSIRNLGRLSYQAMYQQVEQAHFLLALLDEENPDHRLYTTHKSSGTFQLAYGFAKPLIISQFFSQRALATPANSIIYADNASLANAMLQAMDQSPQAYHTMALAMQAQAQQLAQQSLANLQAALAP